MSERSGQVTAGSVPAAGGAVADPDAGTEGVPARKRTLADSAPVSTADRLAERLRQVRGRGALEIGLVFVLVQLGCIISYLVDPAGFPYLEKSNFNVLSQSVPVLAILAVGAGILIIAGEFDLSLGANFTFCALVFTRWYSDGSSAWTATGMAVLTGVAIALLNALLVTKARIPSFIVTLGMMLFWEGAALFYNGTTAALMIPSDTVQRVFTADLGFFRGQALWMVGVWVVFWLLVHRHRLGNHIFAVGGNPAAARAISINPDRVKIIAFGILGVCVALAAVLTAVRTGSVQPGAGRGMELKAIAAAVVGGVALSGGRGSVLGMVLGAALILTVQDILLLGGAPGFYLDLFVGLIIVAAAFFNRLIEGKAK
ncbi:ABC transporter permease [Streptomyces sp. NPDC005811]|uniref:ABC transporter permease n=1 Tax=Streptomyces sp. NPDC005811 TaxID=3154565 RepID=UPI0033CA5384